MSGAHKSFLERTARQRIADLLDANSFAEILPPAERHFSPHLPVLGQPVAFDDGIVIGSGLLSGAKVLIAAQEPAFMGGSVGEIHGAKLTGLLERAVEQRPAAVLLLLDTGGVRLHEANAGLIAISEIQRAVFEVRHAGIPVIVMIGGSNGCYGGIGIVAKCCDHMIISEEGRLSVSGPEVIEAAKGVEEFDARDRALVWRTMGGKHRYLMGDADLIVPDDVAAFRDAAISLLGASRPLTLESVTQEHAALQNRMQRFSDCADATQIWQALGVADAKNVPLAEIPEFLEMSAHVRREEHA
ncbi:biotin-independent malonate decarboxylase subunit beta [Herminiimonas sp. KBW02]|uniref:biotin-independent malonate decarboxylase subunit beta n=1 Tax=Herminiimonas sp. KBW02 TaxID=2153363 RepID=UPI000F596B41|nr:biotin-independent malonate decarboxylase subunit beta [Herminiimonas sp. KBW02]RQO37321.1 biotin-independent malonate decarboxylase subunit beta [Herminiimonas sp. KBW02]